jgi:16S rRNA processing protein RimM
MPDAPRFTVVGRIRRAHGIRGELAVELMTGAPDAVFAPGSRVFAGTTDGAVWRAPETGATRTLTIESVRPFQAGRLVKFEGIDDRTGAESWRGRHLLAPAADLEPPAQGEVYLHELAGMRVLDASGAELGSVRGWYKVPQGYVLEIETPRGMADVPFNEHFVRGVDRVERALAVELPEGLLD